MPNFTDLSIRSMREGMHFDDRLPSFGIRIGKLKKTWLVIKGANRTKVRLGHFPAMSLSEARKKAMAELSRDELPQTAPTFTEARKTFLEVHGATLRPGSLYQLERNLTRHFDWQKTLDQITHRDIMEVIDAIEKPSQRQHAFKDIRTFFNWCVPRYIPYSPCSGLKSPKQSTPRARVLTDDEVKLIWRACEQTGEAQKTDVTAVAGASVSTPRLPANFATIVRLLILTGQRRGEIAQLQSSWINGNTLTIPAEVAKNGRKHVLPVGEIASQLLKTSKQSTFLFLARGKDSQPFNGWSKSKAALDKALGDKVEPFVLHDIRRYFASTHAKIGTPIHVTERLLNHVSGTLGGIVSVYQRHTYFPEMVAAMQQYETYLKKILT